MNCSTCGSELKLLFTSSYCSRCSDSTDEEQTTFVFVEADKLKHFIRTHPFKDAKYVFEPNPVIMKNYGDGNIWGYQPLSKNMTRLKFYAREVVDMISHPHFHNGNFKAVRVGAEVLEMRAVK